MGLETVDPKVLPKLNKRMTLQHYEWATTFLIDHGITVRAFILLRTPFQSEEEGLKWAKSSIDYAFSVGVSLQSGRAMIDLWDIEKFFPCPQCRTARCERLRQINLSQKVPPLIICDCMQVQCGAHVAGY